MSQTKTYLPFPLFIFTAIVVSLGAWYTIKTYSPVSSTVSINEISTATTSCQGKTEGATCQFDYCPPMPACPSGVSCAQVMPPCVQKTGTCQANSCSIAAATVDLTLSPTTVTISPNTDTTISLNVNSGSDRLTFVTFGLSYDQSKLTISSPILGTWLTKVMSPITIANGLLSGEIGTQVDTSVPDGGAEFTRTGTGTLLTFKVRGVPGTYPISFTNQTEAWTLTGNTPNPNNMLKSVSGTSLTIVNPALITDIVGTDHRVNRYDYVELVSQYGKLPAGSADFNHSGAVNAADYTIFLADYGKNW